jgi:UDP-N-acetylmuramoyl-tripeptide--D-alanyl-D-alanine ligase
MKTAIHDFLSSSPETLKACILGDMLEVGEHASTEHLAILQQVSGAGCLFACFIGNQFKQHESVFPAFHFFNNSQEALPFLQNTAPKGYHILLKGSRAIQLETLLGVL